MHRHSTFCNSSLWILVHICQHPCGTFAHKFITYIFLHKSSYHIPFYLWYYYTQVCVFFSLLISLTQMVFAHIYYFQFSSLCITICTFVTNVMVEPLVSWGCHIIPYSFLQDGFLWGSLQQYNLFNNILNTFDILMLCDHVWYIIIWSFESIIIRSFDVMLTA